MKKQNVEQLIKVIEEQKEDIINLSKKCYKKTMDGSCFQGWKTGVIAYMDGVIQTFTWSQGTSNMLIYNGEGIPVVTYTTGNDIPETEITEEDFTEKQKNNFINWLLENEYMEKKEKWEEELSYSRVLEFCEDEGEDIISRVDKETIECEVEQYFYEVAEDAIDNTLEQLKLYLEE